jgi:hypothetical protein
VLSAYIEKTLNSEKSLKNLQKPKIFETLVFTLDRFELSKKPSHATVPLKALPFLLIFILRVSFYQNLTRIQVSLLNNHA